MEVNISSIKKQNEDLFVYVKSIILTYCPYTDNRLSILDNANSPEIDIEVNIRDNQTQVMVLFGNQSFKQGITEQIIITYIIEFDEISEIIDFILGDHEYIQNINLYNNSIGLNFAINWTDEEKQRFVDKYLTYATINSTPLIPLVKEMLDLFKLEGYDFFFITARGLLKKETKEAVIQVFQKNNISTDNIYWEIKDKVLKCKELGIDLMIEDNPSICKSLINNEIKTMYFRDKDNEKLQISAFLTEVSNVGEICRYIFSEYGLKNSSETYEKVLLKDHKRN